MRTDVIKLAALLILVFVSACNGMKSEADLQFHPGYNLDKTTFVFNAFSDEVYTHHELAIQPTVTVKDGYGISLDDYSGMVTLKAYSDACKTEVPAGLSATTNPVTAAAGVASFSGVRIRRNEVTHIGVTSDTYSACSKALNITSVCQKPGVLAGTFAYGDGSADLPYIICDATQFANIATDLTAHFELGQDIDATGLAFSPMADSVTGFTGSLDGAGLTVSNLSYTNGADALPVGIFRMIGVNGSLSNIKFTSLSITGNSIVGGIAGYLAGTLNNIELSGNVTGVGSVGGMVGRITGTSVLTKLTSSGTVSGMNGAAPTGTSTSQLAGVGGIVGEVAGANSTLTDLVSSMTVSSPQPGYTYSKSGTGGVIGSIYKANVIVTRAIGRGDVSGRFQIGAVIGYGYGAAGITITDSHGYGDVTGENGVGGFIGLYGNLSISRSSAHGEVHGGVNTGGFMGGGKSASSAGQGHVFQNYSASDVYCAVANCFCSGFAGQFFTGASAGNKLEDNVSFGAVRFAAGVNCNNGGFIASFPNYAVNTVQRNLSMAPEISTTATNGRLFGFVYGGPYTLATSNSLYFFNDGSIATDNVATVVAPLDLASSPYSGLDFTTSVWHRASITPWSLYPSPVLDWMCDVDGVVCD